MDKVQLGATFKALISEVKDLQIKGKLDEIIDVLNQAIKNPADIISALPEFDCEEVLLYADDDVTVYYIATPSKILYPPHEHGMVAISALYKGTETHVFYDRDGDNVCEKSTVTFESPSVVNLSVDAVHAICTHDDVANEGIHFYLGNLETQKRSLWDVDGSNPRQYIHNDYLSSARPI